MHMKIHKQKEIFVFFYQTSTINTEAWDGYNFLKTTRFI